MCWSELCEDVAVNKVLFARFVIREKKIVTVEFSNNFVVDGGEADNLVELVFEKSWQTIC